VYTERELRFQARSIITAVVNNASFNCNAAKVVVVSRDWPQRDLFANLLLDTLAEAAPRRAYYPGARERYEELLMGHAVEKLGREGRDVLAWAFVRDLDPDDSSEKLFSTEPFCGILSETALPGADAAAFLEAAIAFCNDRLWGTLSAGLVTLKEPELGPALDKAVRDLRYGTVALNAWPAVSYAVMSPPWGGHPTSKVGDIQSGLGWVHNTYLLEGIDKAVFRAPLVPALKPSWHFDNRTMQVTGRRLVGLEQSPGWGKFLVVAAAALRG
jgi:aldehyde dehydrogenase (NAD(P)+)